MLFIFIIVNGNGNDGNWIWTKSMWLSVFDELPMKKQDVYIVLIYYIWLTKVLSKAFWV